MIKDILYSQFGSNPGLTEREEKCNSIAPLEPPKSNTTTRTTNDKYAEDVAALKVFYPLEKGDTIDIDLQDILAIVPRKRPRIDAYQGLVSYVRKNYGVELTIKSRKTHD